MLESRGTSEEHVSRLQGGSEVKCGPTLVAGGAPLPTPEGEPLVTILLCTFNGARFLAAQLASLEHQTHKNWRLIVSDDGSSDDTLTIVNRFAARVAQEVEIRTGPQRGPTVNFLTLAIDPTLDGDLFAFCDQDDIWGANKLARAVSWIGSQPDCVPAVYGGRTRIVSKNGKASGHSPLFRSPPAFANALVQSIAGANTMLFNRPMKRLLEEAGVVDAVSHDWWAYLLATGCGGRFSYDREPQLDYRQHGENSIGCNRGVHAQLHRVRMVVDGRFARWNDMNLQALECCSHLLTREAAELLSAFGDMRAPKLGKRVAAFMASGIRRQHLAGNIALLGAVLFRKV